MSDDLADLVLDGTAPFPARKAAGYALAQIGTLEAKRKLLPLTADKPDDPTFDLKGRHYGAIGPEERRSRIADRTYAATASNYYGAYAGFLSELDRGGFDARGHTIAGLGWAKQFASRRENYERTARIARRITIAALDEIDQPGVADTLAEMLIAASGTYADSPLTPPRHYSWDKEEEAISAPILSGSARCDAGFSKHLQRGPLAIRSLAYCQRNSRIADRKISRGYWRGRRRWTFRCHNETYAEMAGAISWMGNVACIEAWLAVQR